MITFKQFISEETEDFAKTIIRDCGPFLKQIGRGCLIRATENPGTEVGVLNVWDDNPLYVYKRQRRKDRKPLDNSKEMHNAIDNWFDDKFGIKARSQAVFCTGMNGAELLQPYGPVIGVVFPIGEFKYVWSHKVTDLYNETNVVGAESNNKDGEEGLIRLVLDKIDGWGYIDNRLEQAGHSSNEIMLDCESYYFVQCADIYDDAGDFQIIMRYIKDQQ